MVLTVSFVISPVIGLSCHRRQRDAKHHRQLDAGVEASGPHDFAVRKSASRLRAVNRSRETRPAITSAHRRCRVHRIPPRVRDDRDTPLCEVGRLCTTPVSTRDGSKTFFETGLDSGTSKQPAGQISRCSITNNGNSHTADRSERLLSVAIEPLQSHGDQTEINMRRIIYTAIVTAVIGAGSIGASYAAGKGSTSTGLTTGTSTNTTGMSAGTTTGMSNSAGSAAAGANSVSNPSGNQLMPGSPTALGGRAMGGRR